MSDNRIDELISVLRTGEWEAQYQVSEELAQIGAEAVEPLIALMSERLTYEDYIANTTPHHLAEETLIEIGESAVEPLITALRYDSWGAHAGAIYCFSRIEAVRAVQPLIEALHFEDVSSGEVYEALQKTGAELVRPLIFALKNNISSEVRWKAASILGDFHDPLVFPALLSAVEADDNARVRNTALYYLPQYRDARAIEPVIAALQESDAEMREAAVRALGELAEAFNSPRAVATLTQALTDTDWGTCQSAAEMLIRLRADPNSAAENLLLADLQNADAEIRLGSAWSLAELGDDRALDPLVRLLYHPDARISSSAAQGLGELGDQRAIAPLTALLTHTDDMLRQSVERALRRLNEPES